MSWAGSSWKEGLSALQLQKVESQEQLAARLQKDLQQRQIKIDYLQQQLDKEKRKHEEEKGESSGLMRDLQSKEAELSDLKSKHARLQQELATKENQLRQLETQSRASTSQSQMETTGIFSTPVGGRSRFQRFGSYGDTPSSRLLHQESPSAPASYTALQAKVAELEAKLKETQDRGGVPTAPTTPLRAQSLDRGGVQEVDRLRNEKAQLQAKVEELEQRSRQVSQQVDCQLHNSEAARKALEQRSREKELELKEEIRLQAQESAQLRKELNETQTRLQQELTASTKALDATKAQLERGEAKLLAQENLLADLRKQVASLEQLDRQSSSQLADLNRALKNQEQAAKALEAKNASAEAKVRELGAAGDAANREVRRLETELHKSGCSLEQQAQEVAQLQSQLANTKNQLLSLEQQKQSLEKELNQSRSELKREAARCQDLENRLCKAEEKIQELLQVVKEKSGSSDHLRGELDKSQRSVTESAVKVQKLEAKLEATERLEREASQKACTLEQEIQALRKQAEESQAIAKTLREREAEVAALLDSKRALEGTVQQLSKSIEELTRELEQKQESVGCLEKEIADGKDLVSSAGRLRDDLQEALRRCDEIKASLEASEREREELKAKCARQGVECEKIPELESARAKSEALVRQLEELLSERESEKTKLLKDLSEKEAALKDFENEAQELRKKVDQAEVDLKASSDRLLQNSEALKERETALREQETMLERMKQELGDAVQKQRSLEEAEERMRRVAEEKEAEIVALKNDISAEKELSRLLEQQTSQSMAEIETSKNAVELELAAMTEKCDALREERERLTYLMETKDASIVSLGAALREKHAKATELERELVRAKERDSKEQAKAREEKEALEEKLSMFELSEASLKFELGEQLKLHATSLDKIEALNAKLASMEASMEAALREKATAVSAQLAAREELEDKKCAVASLQQKCSTLEEQVSVKREEAEDLQRQVDNLILHELREKVSKIEELERQIEDLYKKEQESRVMREQVARVSEQCSEFEQQCDALRQECEARKAECERTAAERQALEHELVARNAERDEALLELTSARDRLEQALAARLELEQLADARAETIETCNGELRSLTAAVKAADDKTRQVEDRRRKLEEQLEDKDSAVAAISMQLHRNSENAEQLSERLADVEASLGELPELRQQLVEANGERDELCLTLMRVRKEAAARERQGKLALLEALEREAVGALTVVERIRSSELLATRQAGSSGDLLAVVSMLLEMYRIAVGFLEEEWQCLAALEPEVGDGETDSESEEAPALRQLMAERMNRVKEMGEAVTRWVESVPAAADQMDSVREENVSLLESSGKPEVSQNDVESAGEFSSFEPEDVTDMTIGGTDLTNASTCQLTLSSSGSNSSGDELVERMAQVCNLLGAQRRSLQGMLSQTPPPPCTPLLLQYTQQVQDEFDGLQELVELLKGRLLPADQQEHLPPRTVNLRSELRVQSDGTVEAAASVSFSSQPGEDEEDGFCSFTTVDEETSSADATGTSLQDVESSHPAPAVGRSETLRVRLVELEARLNVFLVALAGFESRETLPEEGSDEQSGNYAQLFDCIEMWASNLNDFLKEVKETSTEARRILSEDASVVEPASEPNPVFKTNLALLRQFVEAAVQRTDQLKKDASALHQNLLDEQAATETLRGGMEEREQELDRLRAGLSSLQQRNEIVEDENQNLLKKVESSDLTIKQLNGALEEVEETLQSTFAEKKECEDKVAALQDRCSKADEERALLCSELSLVKDAAEEALAEKSKLLADVTAAKAALEGEHLKLAARVDELDKELLEARRGKKEIEERLEEESKQLAALKVTIEELLSSNGALEASAKALKEELEHVRAVQENQVAEIRSICIAMDVAFTELSATGDTGVDLGVLREALSTRQREFSSQLEQLGEEKNAALLEAAEYREKCSQAHAERDRLEEEKRAVLRQAEEQEQELLKSDQLIEENRALQADVERIMSKLEEIEELRSRVVSLEEEKASKEEQIASLLSAQASAKQAQLDLVEKGKQLGALEEELQLLRLKEQELQTVKPLASKLQDELADLKLQHEAAQKELLALSAAHAKIQSLEASEAKLKECAETLKERNEGQAKELEQLTREIECLQATAEVSNGALQALRDQLSNEKDRTNALEADVARHAATEQELQRDLASLKEEIGMQSSRLASLEDDLRQLTDEKEAISRQLESVIEENKSLTSLLEQKTALVERTRAELEDVSRQLEESKAQLATKQREHQQLLEVEREEVGKLSASKSTLEATVSALSQDLAAAKESCARAESEAKSARKSLKEKTSEAECLQSDYNIICRQLQELKEMAADQAQRQTQQQERLEQTQKEIKKLLETESSLEQQVTQWTKRAEAAERAQSLAEEQVQAANSLLEAKNTEVEECRSEVRRAQEELERAQSAHVTHQEKAAEIQASLQNEIEAATGKLREKEKSHEELLGKQKQLSAELQAATEQRDELTAKVSSLQAQLEASQAKCTTMERKAATALAGMRNQEREWRTLDAENARLRDDLAQAKTQLDQLGGPQRIQELEAEVEVLQQQLSEKRDSAVEAWNKVSAFKKELEQKKVTVDWLRSRMRVYKKRISEMEKKPDGKMDGEDDDSNDAPPGRFTPSTPADAAPDLPHGPVVTKLSVTTQSPSKTEFCVTVSAAKNPNSAPGTPAAKLFKASSSLARPSPVVKQAVMGTEATKAFKTSGATTKRTLFLQTGRGHQSTPVQEIKTSISSSIPPPSPVGVRTRRAAASTSQSNLCREPAPRTKSATPKQSRPHNSCSVQMSVADKENVGQAPQHPDAKPKLKPQEASPCARPKTRRQRLLAVGLSPFGRDTSNIRPRGDSAAPTLTRPQRNLRQQQQQQMQPQPAAEQPSSSTHPTAPSATASSKAAESEGVMTRSKRASAGTTKDAAPKRAPKEDNCKQQ
ncbi:uncharacterized protein LOC144152850 isoform X1 [Haemaphysalis longicornis]